VIQLEKRKLNNVDAILIMIASAKIVKNTAPLRRALYEHRKGTLIGCDRGWYCDYFFGRNNYVGRLWKRAENPRCKNPPFILTEAGTMRVTRLFDMGYTLADVHSRRHNINT
jgi:hypothetical protein